MGDPENTKVRDELADKFIPFPLGILRKTQNFKFLGGWEVLPLDLEFIQRKL